MSDDQGLASLHLAAVQHHRESLGPVLENLKATRAATEITTNWAAHTAAWAKDKGVGNTYATAALIGAAAGHEAETALVEAITAITEASKKLEALAKAVYDMGA
jgi:hypothetical protein